MNKKKIVSGIALFLGVTLFIGCKKEQPTVEKSTPSPPVEQKIEAPAEPELDLVENQPVLKETDDSESVVSIIEDNSSSETEETGVSWLTDYEKAKAKADKEGKDLVINFSGSDWCYWCIRLEKEVFSQEAFAGEAEKYFVFILVDFPDDDSFQSEEVKSQNMKLARMYGFRGMFPTIYLASADGRPYALAEYKEGGPQVYLEYLLEIRKYKNR